MHGQVDYNIQERALVSQATRTHTHAYLTTRSSPIPAGLTIPLKPTCVQKRGGTHLRKNFKIVAAVLTGTLLKQHTKRKKDYGCDSEQRTSLAANKLKKLCSKSVKK